MKLQRALSIIHSVRPGISFDDGVLVEWINEIEGKVQTDILHKDPEDCVFYTQQDGDRELLVPDPFSKLYRYFLVYMIDLAHGEIPRFMNSFAEYAESYQEFSGWYAESVCTM